MKEPDLDAIERASQRLRWLREYCRLEVEGAQSLPEGPFILVANHTGWAGLDYANLFLTVRDATGRIPRVAVHPSYFRFRRVRHMAQELGFFEVSVATSTEILDHKGIVTFFPEAEEGNFKPIWKRYQLQPFKPGFARVALATEVPIVPAIIVGGEDASPSLGRWRAMESLVDFPVPIPLNLLPLPAKWRIAFLPQVDPTPYLERESPDEDVAEMLSRDLQARMQRGLDDQVVKRGHAFLP